MDVKINTYRFNLSDKVEANSYAELINKMKPRKARRVLITRIFIELIEDLKLYPTIALITSKIYTDTWETANGWLFEWCEVLSSDNICTGYYLDITDDMQLLRDNTYQCPSCGRQSTYPQLHRYFCSPCIDNIREESKLYECFLRPVSLLDTPVNPKNIIIPSWVRDQWLSTHVHTAY